MPEAGAAFDEDAGADGVSGVTGFPSKSRLRFFT